MLGIVFMILARVCLASWSDELTGRAVNTATSLAKGDVNGAAGQAIGGYNVPIAPQSNVYLSPGNVGFQQAIRPLSSSNPYLNVGTAYNAGFNPINYSHPSQNVQMNAGNQFFSNSTTVPIPTNFKRR